jgi:hypothetical protein
MSINSDALKVALKGLNIPFGKQIRFENVAKALNYVPKKMVKGKETKQALKVGGQKYKEAVYNEVIRRRKEKQGKIKKTTESSTEVKNPISLKGKKLVESLMNKKFTKWNFNYSGIDNEEDFYNAIKNEVDGLGGGTSYIMIYFRRKDDGEITEGRAMRSDNIYDFADFEDELAGMFSGMVKSGSTGSDPINKEEYEIDYSTFSIGVEDIGSTNGSSEDMVFYVKGIQSKKNLCVYESLLACGYDSNKYGVKPESLRDITKLTSLILKEKLPIAVIGNGFLINKKSADIIARNPIKKEIKEKKRITNNVCGKLDMDDVEIVYITGSYEDNYFIVYDEVNNHADICVGKPKLMDNIYLGYGGRIIKEDRILFTCREININNKSTTKTPVEYVFFDYETIIDFNSSSCMRPYSLSILTLTPFQLTELERIDEEYGRTKDEKLKDQIKDIRNTNCKTFLGYDCNNEMLKWFAEYQLDKMLIFVGFNNTNFDNFILLEGFLNFIKENPTYDYRVSDVFFNGNQLLNFRINGRHNMFDIRKHLMGSLKKNCKDFKIECCAKKEFNHNYAQELFDDDKLIEYITGNDELKEYNEYDVLATAVLYKRYMNALEAIPATQKYAKDIYQTKTIGSLIYKVFSDNKSKKQFDLPKLDFETYNNLQKSKIAGRVEMFNGVQKVQERLVSTDVCSLYPYVMSVLNCYYPCGEMVETAEYKGDDVIGFYYCDIDQSCLKDKNLPNIYAEKLPMENDWSSTNVLENYLISNVMIGLLRKYGCDVVIKKGFTFTEKKKSCDMFGFLLEFMKEKNKQDSLKGKEGYNPALRETLKLLMNSLSGKVIEGLHTEKTIDIDTCAEFLKIKEKATSINFINAVGGKMFLTYEVDAESLINQQRPIYLGVLIYDYAKRYMFENSYSKIGKSNLLYTDTDASKFRYKDFINWKKWVDEENIQVPHWKEVEDVDERYKNHKIYQDGSKVFGSFEDELEDAVGDEYLFYCLEKKSWLYSYKKDGEWHSKYRFKGLNGSAQMLTLEEPFIGNKVINHKDGATEVKFYLKPECEYQVYKYYLANQQNNIDNGNEIKFFDKIYTTGEAYMMCNSFRKIVKNSSRNVDIDDEEGYNTLMNKIQVRYNIKKIQIKSIANI